jgi:hypothetical protein
MFWFGLGVGLAVAVGEYFVLKNNPKYLNLNKMDVNKLEKLYADVKKKLGIK